MFKINSRRLLKDDFDRSCTELASFLLGKVLVRRLEDDTVLKGRIVETESYLGGEDRGSHSFNGRRTVSNEAMYMPAGTSYVYITYGICHCFNISSNEPGAAVLLRALEPLCGTETMEKLRVQNTKSSKKPVKPSKLCNGPSKLCIAMNIKRDSLNKVDLTDLNNDKLWLEDDPDFDNNDITVVRTSRVGIASAGEEWAKKPLRFYILNCDSVSKRDRHAEKYLELLKSARNRFET